MVMPALDLTGQWFGYLQVCRPAGLSAKGKTQWWCKCLCGNTTLRLTASLRSIRPTTVAHCGCRAKLVNVKHGMSQHRAYRIWTQVKRRCLDKTHKDYPNYGGRGITIDPRWAKSFAEFWADMQGGYAAHLTLGRKDNDLGYSRMNCRWETHAEQDSNKRTNRWLDTPKGRMTLSQAAEAYQLSPQLISYRLKQGWPLIRALEQPARL